MGFCKLGGRLVYIAHINDRWEKQNCNDHSRNTAIIALSLLKSVNLSYIEIYFGRVAQRERMVAPHERGEA